MIATVAVLFRQPLRSVMSCYAAAVCQASSTAGCTRVNSWCYHLIDWCLLIFIQWVSLDSTIHEVMISFVKLVGSCTLFPQPRIILMIMTLALSSLLIVFFVLSTTTDGQLTLAHSVFLYRELAVAIFVTLLPCHSAQERTIQWWIMYSPNVVTDCEDWNTWTCTAGKQTIPAIPGSCT